MPNGPFQSLCGRLTCLEEHGEGNYVRAAKFSSAEERCRDEDPPDAAFPLELTAAGLGEGVEHFDGGISFGEAGEVRRGSLRGEGPRTVRVVGVGW